jgi:hypothetical protein
MKTASTVLQLLALSVCLAIHLGCATDFRMPGIRRAIQTMASAGTHTMAESPHAVDTDVDL